MGTCTRCKKSFEVTIRKNGKPYTQCEKCREFMKNYQKKRTLTNRIKSLMKQLDIEFGKPTILPYTQNYKTKELRILIEEVN